MLVPAIHPASRLPGYTIHSIPQSWRAIVTPLKSSHEPYLPWEGEPPAHPAPPGLCFHRQMRRHLQRTLQTPAHEGHLSPYCLTALADLPQQRCALSYLRAGTACSSRHRHSWEFQSTGTAARHRKASLQPELDAESLARAQQIRESSPGPRPALPESTEQASLPAERC